MVASGLSSILKMGTLGAPQTAKADGEPTDWQNCWRDRNVLVMCSARTRPWATKYNVKVGLVLGGCSLRWLAGVSSNLDYSTSLKPDLLPFLALYLLDFCLFCSRCSKETPAMFWRIQGTAGTANLWSKKPLQTLDQSRYCTFAWRKTHSWKHSWANISGFLFCFVFFFCRCRKEARGQFPVCLCFSTAQATETEIAGGQKKEIWRDSEAVIHTDFHRKGFVIVALSITVEVFCCF